MQKVAEKKSIRVNGPAVIFPLVEWRRIEEDIEDYKEKKNVAKNLKRFEDLARWGRGFAKKKGITKQQVLEDD
jgi:hypothetical protein